MIVLQQSVDCCHIDAALTAAIFVYEPSSSEEQRLERFRTLKETLPQHGICSHVGDYMDLVRADRNQLLAAWNIANLTNDDHCISSALMLQWVNRVPLLIDPHGVALKWLSSQSIAKGTKITHLYISSSDCLEQLSSCVQLGSPVVLELTEMQFEPAVYPLLLKQTFNQGPTNYVKFVNEIIEYSPDFQLFLRTETPVTDERLLLCVVSVDFTLQYQVRMLSYHLCYESYNICVIIYSTVCHVGYIHSFLTLGFAGQYDVGAGECRATGSRGTHRTSQPNAVRVHAVG